MKSPKKFKCKSLQSHGNNDSRVISTHYSKHYSSEWDKLAGRNTASGPEDNKDCNDSKMECRGNEYRIDALETLAKQLMELVVEVQFENNNKQSQYYLVQCLK